MTISKTADTIESIGAVETDVAALAKLLGARKPLPAECVEDDRSAATAALLAKAGAAVSPMGRNPHSVLASLSTLEGLAGLKSGFVARRWLAVRALALTPGRHVGGSLAADPVCGALLGCAGLTATCDLDDKVHGVLGNDEGRSADAVAAGSRSAVPGGKGVPFEVLSGGSVLMAEPAGGCSAVELLAGIDALAAAAAAPAAAKGALGPIAYETVEPGPAGALSGDSLFEAYKPARIRFQDAKAHPSPLVESAALASVLPPVPTYRPVLPAEVVRSGALSDVQLETVLYAGQAHGAYLPSDPLDPNGTAPRQGFLVGHGTGVGKGRIVSGIVADNWAQGRKRAVWVTERHRHLKDARRDWTALGGRADDLIDLREFSPDDRLPARNGVLFCTYPLLRGENEKDGAKSNRVDQIVDWLGQTSDGVVVFDESQNLRNAIVREGAFGMARSSRQGEAALRLQTSLPNARVVYASATAASDIASLGYAVRLGLWGRGTAFPTAAAFFDQMEAGGMNALELVARDLKALGLYLAANLSFEGVRYEKLEYKLTDAEKAVQDELAAAWAEVNLSLQSAMASTGVGTLAANAGRGQCALYTAQFGMSRSRFFQALLASIKMGPTIDAIRKDQAAGHASVIQLTNTYEANADRAVAESKTGDMNEVEATPRDILLEYVRKQFPTQRFQVRRNGKHVSAVPMFDAQGNPVLCPKAVKARDDLIVKIGAIEMPEGPLEQLFTAFGRDAVAEVTGRRRRLVPGPVPGARILEERTQVQVEEDIRAFQAGGKTILVFSSSGAAGSSYHADRASAGQALRRHYLVQPGWRADLAIQGLGRTHRSNQAQPPVYVLVSTDLWADRRMISTVASGMQRLGAITRGQRQAASQDLFGEDDNLESAAASDAWIRFLRDLEAGLVPNLSLGVFERDTGIPIRMPGTNVLMREVPEVRRFLNAMSGMTCAHQESFGTAYKARLDDVRMESIRDGSFDRGIETLAPESLIKLSDTVIYRDARTGAATRLLQMLRRDPVRPVTYQDAQRNAFRSGNARFVKSALTNRIACLVFPKTAAPNDEDKVTVITPTGLRNRRRGDVRNERWVLTNAREAEDLWEAELSQPMDDDETVFHVVSGTLLPLWDKLPKRRAVVWRMVTDEGEPVLGRVLPQDWVDAFSARAAAMNGHGTVDPILALAEIEKGNIAVLANGWTVEGRTDHRTGGSKVEVRVTEADPSQHRAELESDGLVVEDDLAAKKLRFRLPADPAARAAAWAALIQNRPVLSVAPLF